MDLGLNLILPQKKINKDKMIRIPNANFIKRVNFNSINNELSLY